MIDSILPGPASRQEGRACALTATALITTLGKAKGERLRLKEKPKAGLLKPKVESQAAP
ncbi:MAG: hypothetical protein WA005_06635 [Candidatus Binataceae bacterium]